MIWIFYRKIRIISSLQVNLISLTFLALDESDASIEYFVSCLDDNNSNNRSSSYNRSSETSVLLDWRHWAQQSPYYQKRLLLFFHWAPWEQTTHTFYMLFFYQIWIVLWTVITPTPNCTRIFSISCNILTFSRPLPHLSFSLTSALPSLNFLWSENHARIIEFNSLAVYGISKCSIVFLPILIHFTA